MGNQWGARGRGTRSAPAAREEPRSSSERFGAFGGWSSRSRAGPGMLETGQPGFGVRVRVEGSLPGAPPSRAQGEGEALTGSPSPSL